LCANRPSIDRAPGAGLNRRMAIWASALVAIAAVLAVLAGLSAGDPLDDRIAANEDIVRGLQALATELYADREEVVPACECSRHACSNAFEDSLVCTEVLGLSDTCSACEVEGMLLAMNSSFVRTPPGSDPNNLPPEVIESFCTFQSMDKEFVEQGPNGSFTWSYIGTTTGTIRVWPGQPRRRDLIDGKFDEQLGNCRQYDPRIRPWFIAASSGPKDVVIILDASGSMRRSIAPGAAERWKIAADAVDRLLDTFSIADFVSIVTFNSKAAALGGAKTLLRMNDTSKQMLKEALTIVEPERGTDFRTGFEAGFNTIIESMQIAEKADLAPTSLCTKVILFLTDGEDCTLRPTQNCSFDASKGIGNGGTEPGMVLDFIEEKQAELEALGSTRAHIFTFSMTSDADDMLPKMIACENEGSWSAIEEKDDPLFKFLDYTRFFAWGRRGLDVIWSNFYVDDGGLGDMTTAAMPVYSPDTAKGMPGVLIGVVGKDVLVSQLEQDDEDFIAVFNRIIERTSVCRKSKLNVCQLQVLRGKKAECPDVLPDAQCYFLQDTDSFYMSDPSQKLAFEEAEAACVALGGQLTEVGSGSEHAFLSGLATSTGSWIGLRKKGSEFSWLQSGGSVLSPTASAEADSSTEAGEDVITGTEGVLEADLWAIRAEGKNDCATIDRRGTIKNVVDVNCSAERTFICKFDAQSAPEQCMGSKTVRVDQRYDPKVPPLEDCNDFEIALLASTEVVEATKGLGSADAVCPLGEEKRTTEEVKCCCSDVGCVTRENGSPCFNPEFGK